LKKKQRTLKARLMDPVENSAPKTLRVFHSSHSLCYWLDIQREKAKEKTLSLFNTLDIHIAVR
jgi:hypothetical protein